MITILWDFVVITVSQIKSNRPDIVVFLKEAPKKILLIEVSCPADTNVADKVGKKVEKYQWLAGKMLQSRCSYNSSCFGVSGIVSKQQKAI